MFEIGVFHNGASSLPVVVTKDGVAVNDGSLAEVHAPRRRSLVNQVRQGILAEKLGFQSFWLTEHHFQPEGAEMSPNPLFTQMAIAAQTKRIRLGQCANIVVWHHPVRHRRADRPARRDQRRARRMRHGPRLPAARERDAGPPVRLDDPGPGAQPQGLRGGGRDHPQMLDGAVLLASRREFFRSRRPTPSGTTSRPSPISRWTRSSAGWRTSSRSARPTCIPPAIRCRRRRRR